MTVELKYGLWTSGVMAFESSPTVISAVRFEIVPQNTRLEGKALNQDYYTHKIDNRNEATLVISANALADSTTWNYMITFYNADGWKINDVEYHLLDAGKMPVEFLEGNTSLREVTLRFVEV